jgi:hypothetical protein
MPLKDKELARERQKEYSRRWYLKNQKDQIQKSKSRKKLKRKEWEAYKAKQKCSHCGFSHPAVIDFHHIIRRNKKSVNKLAAVKNNIPEAIREAETKCIPLCSNCHRILHWKEHKIDKKKSSR